MRLSRAERSLLVDWWFTVDRALLAAILVIVAAGLLLSLAASPSIALKRGLPTFYFVERHVAFALASVTLLLVVSLLSPPQVRRLALAVLIVFHIFYIGPLAPHITSEGCIYIRCIGIRYPCCGCYIIIPNL